MFPVELVKSLIESQCSNEEILIELQKEDVHISIRTLQRRMREHNISREPKKTIFDESFAWIEEVKGLVRAGCTSENILYHLDNHYGIQICSKTLYNVLNKHGIKKKRTPS